VTREEKVSDKKHCNGCHDTPNELSHQAHRDQPDCCCCYEHLRRYASYDVTVLA